jgi:hypothetical protein
MTGSGKIEEFSQHLDDLYSVQSRKLYRLIEKIGEKAFTKEGPLYKYKKTALLDKLIEYFVSTEEYEKCAYLNKIKEKISK